MNVTIAVDPGRDPRISPYIFSTFFEYFGRVIYDGIWVGPESGIPNERGIRRAVIEGCREAGIAAMRWPGGCSADHYHWKDGVGAERKPRFHPIPMPDSPVWRHDFGTDEFLRFCELCEAEPVIVTNAATGTTEEFLDWYEYVNGPKETVYGSQRAANGHPAPYGVTYWGIGNTDENVWQTTYQDPMPYARTFRRFQTAVAGDRDKLRLIGLGLSMRHKLPGWVGTSLDYITGGQRQRGPDLLSIHHYLGGMKGETKAAGPAVDYTDEQYYFLLDSLERYQIDIDLHRGYIRDHTNPEWPTKICFDEWGTWHPEATSEHNTNQRQTMRDGVFAALALHIFFRSCDIVEFAMETQLCNLLQSLFETRRTKFFKTPTFYVMKLLKEHKGRRLAEVRSAERDRDVDIVASAGEGRLVVSLVNRHLYDQKVVTLTLPPGVWRQTGAGIVTCTDVRMTNSFEAPENITDGPYAATETDPGVWEFALPPFSVVRVVFGA